MSEKRNRLAGKRNDAKWLSRHISRGVVLYQKYVERADFQIEQFWKLESCDPGYDPKTGNNAFETPYQTNVVRNKWEKMMARMCENPAIIECKAISGKPSDTALADDASEMWNSALLKRQEEMGTSIQQGLSNGQLNEGFSVLHWWRADQKQPRISEGEYTDDVPEGEDKDWRAIDEDDRAQRPKEDDDAYEKRKERMTGKKHMRTESSLRTSVRQKRASAGFPYQWAVLDSRQVKARRDSVGASGTVTWIRTLELLDYGDELEQEDIGIDLTMDVDNRIYDRIEGEERDPVVTANDFNRNNCTITVATVWTRDSFYELFTLDKNTDSYEKSEWTLVKSDKHGFGAPPFAVVPAWQAEHPEPERRYAAFLHAMYDLKPSLDFSLTMLLNLQRDAAQALNFYKPDPKAPSRLTDSGDPIELSSDVNAAKALPAGVDLVQLHNDVSTGFVSSVELLLNQMEQAAPPDPLADVGAATKAQPWSLRTIVQQSSIIAKMGISAQALAIQQMVRSIMRDIQTPPEDGGYGESVSVYRRGDNFKGEDKDQTVEVLPEQVPSMEYFVSINPISKAEQITMVEHGKLLYQPGGDARPFITRDDWLTNYLNVANPGEYAAQLDGEALFNEQLRPGIQAQLVGEAYGGEYVVDKNGKFLGLGAQQVDPNALAMQNGWKPQQSAVAPPGVGGAGQMGVNMGPLTDQAPNGVIPQPALVG